MADPQHPSVPHSPRRRTGAIVILLAITGVVLLGPLDYARDAAFHPWALARPSLMTGWQGTLTTGNGERLVVTLKLDRAKTSGGERTCARCNQLEGTASTCDARGVVRTYRIEGSPRDRQATSILLGAVPEPQPPPDGLELDVLDGAWERPGTLQMNADFHWRRGRSAISSTDDPATLPVPVRLARRDEANLAPCG